MSKKKPCGLDYCPQEEIVGAYASCTACAWGNDVEESQKLEEMIRQMFNRVYADHLKKGREVEE